MSVLMNVKISSGNVSKTVLQEVKTKTNAFTNAVVRNMAALIVSEKCWKNNLFKN